MTKSYFVCLWHHDFPDEPVELYSELDEKRLELRKVYVFRDGRAGVAGPNLETENVFLSEGPMPPLEDIAADPQFEPKEITQEEFEAVWLRYTA